MADGIRVQWTRRHEETVETFLTFDRARELFGLGGTPDSLVTQRIKQTATQAGIITAATADGPPQLLTWTSDTVTKFDVRQWLLPDTAPVPDPVDSLRDAARQVLRGWEAGCLADAVEQLAAVMAEIGG
jgi:hypothetical protein